MGVPAFFSQKLWDKIKFMATTFKKRILLITARADLGGGPKQVAEILEHLSREFEFFVAAPEVGEFATILKSRARSYYPLPHRKASLSSLLGLFKFIRDHEIDLIHTHGFGASIFSLLPALFGARVIHTFHGLHFQSGLKARLKIWLEKLSSTLRQEHICVSRSEQIKAKQLAINSVVIPNGISKKARLSKKKIGRWPPKIAGVISRLDPFKNISWVIINYQKFATLWPGLQIEIAGEGEEKNHLVALIKKSGLENQIKLVGSKSPNEFFEHIDLAIFPSLGEGLPYTVLEAMAYGLPLVASDVPGHQDLLLNRSLFSLMNPDLQSLAPQNLVEYNRSLIIDQFDLSNNLRKLAILYRGC